MFYNCESLELLNLNNFNLSIASEMSYMLYNCLNLEYINLKNAKETSNLNYNYIFNGVPENIVFCANENTARNIFLLLKNKKCPTFYCLNDWKDKQKKMILKNNEYECINEIPISSYISNIESTYINEITQNIDLTNFEDTILIESTDLITENINNSKIEDNNISQIILISDHTDKDNIENSDNYKISNELENINFIFSEDTTENNEIIDYCNVSDFYEIKCNNCLINIIYIKDNLTINLTSKYIDNFINESLNNIYNFHVFHYINNDLNFTITIFNQWYCTNLLLEYDYFEINQKLLLDRILNNLNNNKDYIFVYINMKSKSYMEVYNLSEKIRINLNLICQHCFEDNILPKKIIL